MIITTKVFCDSANLDDIKKMSKNPFVKGFTTNPTLMRKSGITDYEKFARETIEFLAENRPDTCLSLEVFSDEEEEIYRQAKIIDSWSVANYPVYVKLPITDTSGKMMRCIHHLQEHMNIKLNITAVFTKLQIDYTLDNLSAHSKSSPAIISIFAGRIADAGYNPEEFIKFAITQRNKHFSEIFGNNPDRIQILWASPREVYNLVQAGQLECDIITMTPDLIEKAMKFRRDLSDYSLETVRMFYKDAIAAEYKI